ncbi:MAG: MBL fold metallo-hydrolase [Chloroflexi bacterium]|nr:MBL fold metallo-hydrolase [Chloroflexota bacterium]
MNLEIVCMTLGPVETNAYLVGNSLTKEAAVIDPSWDGHLILEQAQSRGWRIANIWLTHAHFDHFGGAAAVSDGSNPPPPVALHPLDYPLWRSGGGSKTFGIQMDPGPEPTVDFTDGQHIYLGDIEFHVQHAPGHSPGHVMLYCPEQGILFCGDVIFTGSIGRTDLPGGDYEVLMETIQDQVLTLPNETRLLPGHGLETSVLNERNSNPFLQGLGEV